MSKELGLFYPDGSFKSDDEIRREFAQRKIFDEATEFLQHAQRLEGRFEVGVKEATFHPLPEYPKAPIAIWHATDIHYGSIRTNYDLLQRHLRILEETPNFYVLFNGDDVDNFNIINASATGVYEDPLMPQRQTQAWMAKIEELGKRGKIGVMSFGNHNNMMLKAGYDWLESFARNLRVNVFTSGGLLHLLHGEQHYPIAITHMYWGNCLGGSTRLLVKTPHDGIIEVYLKDIVRVYGNPDGTMKEDVFLVGKDGNWVKIKRWQKRKTRHTRHIKFRDGLELICSDNHRFLLEDGRLVEAKNLAAGDVVAKKSGVDLPKQSETIWNTEVQKIRVSSPATLYDIEVEGELFCLTNGAITHNSKLNPTNMGKRFWEHEYPEAEIILLGHTHQSELLHWERGGKERFISIGGTYKTDDRWARQHGLGSRSGCPGHAIVLFPNEHRFIGFKRMEDARDFLVYNLR